jgi:hypothetical protein
MEYGEQPLKRGYQPTQGDLGHAPTGNVDTTKPPQGGSGVSTGSSGSTEKK